MIRRWWLVSRSGTGDLESWKISSDPRPIFTSQHVEIGEGDEREERWPGRDENADDPGLCCKRWRLRSSPCDDRGDVRRGTHHRRFPTVSCLIDGSREAPGLGP